MQSYKYKTIIQNYKINHKTKDENINWKIIKKVKKKPQLIFAVFIFESCFYF